MYMAWSTDLLPLIFCATRLEEARLDEGISAFLSVIAYSSDLLFDGCDACNALRPSELSSPIFEVCLVADLSELA